MNPCGPASFPVEVFVQRSISNFHLSNKACRVLPKLPIFPKLRNLAFAHLTEIFASSVGDVRCRAGDPRVLCFKGKLRCFRVLIRRLIAIRSAFASKRKNDVPNKKQSPPDVALQFNLGRGLWRIPTCRNVLIQLASPEIVPLCLGLTQAKAFLSDPDRKSFLLEALARVVPMSAESVAAFSGANSEGYFAFNARLLAENSSPAALGLFLTMMLDEEEDIDTRVELLHASPVPVRNRLPIIEMVSQIAARNPGETLVNAAIESIYDFQVTWRKGHPAPPQPWRTASTESLKALVALAPHLKKHLLLPETLQTAMAQTTLIASEILARRNA